MELERLQLMLNQNLNILLDLASDWAVQLNMELSRGAVFHRPRSRTTGAPADPRRHRGQVLSPPAPAADRGAPSPATSSSSVQAIGLPLSGAPTA